MDREQMIQAYLDAYNQCDVAKMVQHFAQNLVFENIQNGEVTMTLNGLAEFKQQAEQAKSYFSEREQKIIGIKHIGTTSEVEIAYRAVLAMDFPNGMRKGQVLELSGKSVFEFAGDQIIKLSDIS
jgi:ketosteroid isomerase-like protein